MAFKAPIMQSSALAILAASIAAAPAAAQEDGNTDIEEIIVTATKRATSVRDVPIAVTAISAQQLERNNVVDIKRLEKLAPSFKIQSSNSESFGTTLRIRGVGTTGNNTGLESSVGVFLDGAFLSRPGVALGELPDVEQVEVLRGPQGTLFGRNTSAGALVIQSRRPNLQEIEGLANITYGNFDLINFQGAVSVPVIEDQLAFRLTGATRHQDGFVTSTKGAESNNRDRFLIRGQALWEPSDNLSLRIIGDYQETNENCCDPIILQDTPLVDAGLFAAVGLGPTGGVTASGDDAFDDLISNSNGSIDAVEQWGLSAELVWDFANFTLTYIPTHREFESFTNIDADFVALDGFSGFPRSVDIQTHTQELRFQGTAFGGRLDWLVGGYYADEDIVDDSTLTSGADFQQLISTLFLAGGVTALGPNPALVLAQGVSADGNFSQNVATQDARSFAFFTHNIFYVTDDLTLTFGLRYTDERKEGALTQPATTPLAESACFNVITNPAFADPALAPLQPQAIALSCIPSFAPADLQQIDPALAALPLPQTFDDVFEDEEFTYTVNLQYALTEETNVYGSVTHGFKSGGFNLDPGAALLSSDPSFVSEEVDSFEVGLKTALFSGRVNANLAAFHSEIDNLQVLEFTGVAFNVFNVPRARSTGFELEVATQVTEKLSLNFGVTYADARYPSNCDAGLDDPAPLISNLCGEQLTNAPDVVLNSRFTYESYIDQLNLAWFVSGNTRFESAHRTSTQATDLATGLPLIGDIQEANAQLDFRAGFGAENGWWTLEGWVQNATDVRSRGITVNATLRGLGIGAARAVFPFPPRTFGATLRFRY